MLFKPDGNSNKADSGNGGSPEFEEVVFSSREATEKGNHVILGDKDKRQANLVAHVNDMQDINLIV